MERRRPDIDELWSDNGLVCWIDPQHMKTYIPYTQVRSIRKHIEKGGSIHDCPIPVDRWAFSRIMVDMKNDLN
jgi:hypothetical protein